MDRFLHCDYSAANKRATMRHVLVCAFTVAVTSVGCGGGGSSPTGPGGGSTGATTSTTTTTTTIPAGGSAVSFRLDGAATAATSVTASFVNGIMTVGANAP